MDTSAVVSEGVAALDQALVDLAEVLRAVELLTSALGVGDSDVANVLLTAAASVEQNAGDLVTACSHAQRAVTAAHTGLDDTGPRQPPLRGRR